MRKIYLGAAVAVLTMSAAAGMTPVSAAGLTNCPTGSIQSGVPITPDATGDITTGKNYANCNLKASFVKNAQQCNMETDELVGNKLFSTLQTVINVVLSVLGFVAVAMLIIGGVTYQTSQGDAAKVKKGKDTIMYGIIGLVVALLGYAIVNFILTNVFK